MRQMITIYVLLLSLSMTSMGQITVTTLVKDLKASGGVTLSPDGTIIISDFGSALNHQEEKTKVYEYHPVSQAIRIFGEGFAGASGAAFDADGNFYQSNPKGNMISRRAVDGTWKMDWVTEGLNTPIGISVDEDGSVFVCNCTGQSISRITKEGKLDTFAESGLFNCPNGLTRDYYGNLFACNFNDGKVLKLNPWGDVEVWAELPVLQGGPSPVGNGHLTWANGNLIVTTIGTGEIYLIPGKNKALKLCGTPFAFSNVDGDAHSATFSKPNGVAATSTSDTLFVNCSEPSWRSDALKLHPAPLRMITGVCQVDGVHCWSREEKKAIDLIRDKTRIFSQAYIAGDYDKLADAYTVDGKIMPNGSNIISGRTDIKARWILPDDQKILHHKVYHEEIKITGAMAYDYGYYEGATLFNNGKSEVWKGKYLIIWKKEGDDWKIYVDIWNRVS